MTKSDFIHINDFTKEQIYEIFDKSKSESYDTSKIQRFDTSKNKFMDLAGELEKKKGSIENMYQISVDEINKNVFSDNLI